MNIVFCHNVYNRFNTLLETIAIEKKLFPESNSIIGYNAENPYRHFHKLTNMDFIKFEGLTHKIGCTNGCISTIKSSLQYDPDVVIFSHDDVMLNPAYKHIVDENIELIKNGTYDVICRKPDGSAYGSNYYLMEVFFLSKKAVEEIFKNMPLYRNENDISRDVRGSISPEVFLYNAINGKNLKVKELIYQHTLNNYNYTLSNLTGYVHKNAGDRGWTD